MEIVLDRLVVAFHGSPIKVLNRSVEKSYIILTASDFFCDGTFTPKTDRFRGEGSNQLVKLIRGWIDPLANPIRRIDSASGSDPPGSV